MNAQTASRRRIVVGVDDSPEARCAAEWAGYEAERLGFALHLLHALESSEALSYGSGPAPGRDAGVVLGLAAQLRRRHSGIEVTTEVVPGPADRALVDAGCDAELVVTGCRAYASAAVPAPGSVTRALAARGRRPFAVVRGGPRDPSRGEIVLGIGPGENVAPIRYALRRALEQGSGSRVLAVRAWQPAVQFADGKDTAGADELESEQREQARTLLDAAGENFPEARLTIEAACDAAVPALLLAAAAAQVLVVGARRDSVCEEPQVGSTIYELLVHCPVPLVVVPSAVREE